VPPDSVPPDPRPSDSVPSDPRSPNPVPPGVPPAGEDDQPDQTGLELARSVAGRIAANSTGRGRRRRSSAPAGPGAPATGAAGTSGQSATAGQGRAGVGGRRVASAAGRVGGLASRAPFTGPGPDEHDPTAGGAALHELVTARGWAMRADASAVLTRWSDLVGEQTAAHCQPVGIEEGRLRVRADSSAWATQLRLLGPRLVAAVNDRVGSAVVSELVVDGPTAPSWRHGRLGVQGGRGPRDTYG